nr:APC family permease [Actinomadura madurae]
MTCTRSSWPSPSGSCCSPASNPRRRWPRRPATRGARSRAPCWSRSSSSGWCGRSAATRPSSAGRATSRPWAPGTTRSSSSPTTSPGWAWIVLALALLNSAIAGALAGQNAGARVLYALGRANVLPAALGRVHRTYRTPALALTLIYVLNLALSFALGGWLGPVAAFSFIGLFVTLGVIVLYVMGNIAVVRLFRTRFRAEFNPLKHVLVPLLASAVLVVGLYYSLVPWPDWPLNLAVIIVACWLCLGVLLAFALGKTRRDALDRAAQLMFSDDTAEADDPGARA